MKVATMRSYQGLRLWVHLLIPAQGSRKRLARMIRVRHCKQRTIRIRHCRQRTIRIRHCRQRTIRIRHCEERSDVAISRRYIPLHEIAALRSQ
jgi:hypothetical protein